MTATFEDNAMMKNLSLTAVMTIATCLTQTAPAQDDPHAHHKHPTRAPAEVASKNAPSGISIPDVEVLDQEGRRVRFYTDLVKGKVVAINFIFTTCTTICPPLGAAYSKVQELMADRMGKEVHLISISVDPAVDNPARLKQWAGRFQARPGWTLVTGERPAIDELLKGLGGFSARIEDHTPTILIGDEGRGVWTRAYGLAPPSKLVEAIDGVAGKREAASPAQKYFTDVPLVNQYGKDMKFYSDLLKGKVVIINAFFTSCTGVCPPMNKNLERVQEWLGGRLGKEAYIISISVDPETDTPPRLKDYAMKFNARRGWFFITGKKDDVNLALHKLGQKVAVREDHTTVIIIGNEGTGLWKKANGMANHDALIKVVESVLNDKPADATGGGR